MAMTADEEKDVLLPPAARALRKELFSDELIDELMSRVDEGGVSLTGQGGFLPELVKAVLERGMDAELTSHLGYERGDRAGRGSGNSRNGTTPKTVGTRSVMWAWISRGTATPRSPQRWCPRAPAVSAAWRT